MTLRPMAGGEADNVVRLALYRREHPEVVIRRSLACWIAEVPGHAPITFYWLGDLLDRLEALAR